MLCSACLPPLYQECRLSRQPGRGILLSDRHPGATMSDRLTRLSEHLYRFDDTCNVYLLTDGAAGLLIDAGSGAVLDHLRPTGVQRVEWVQCAPRVRPVRYEVLAPEGVSESCRDAHDAASR